MNYIILKRVQKFRTIYAYIHKDKPARARVSKLLALNSGEIMFRKSNMNLKELSEWEYQDVTDEKEIQKILELILQHELLGELSWNIE